MTNNIISSLMNFLCRGFLSHFLYFYFNNWPIFCFLYISPHAVFRSLSRTRVSRQRFDSLNRNLNGGFDGVIVWCSFCWRESDSLELIDFIEDIDSMKYDGNNTRFISLNIFHIHSITEFVVYKNILIVWKPAIF